MNKLNNKKVLLIICGGIAAYKSLELIRILRRDNNKVKTVLTNSGKQFVTPLSITSLSNEKVYTDIFDYKTESEIDHISLSRWADIILIAPATANTISKISNGLADDLASTLVLASNKKIFIAPAMNVRMWENKTNKENINKLNEFGYSFIGPEIGDMACGEYGEGKMSEPEKIFDCLNKYLQNIENNNKKKVLVTAGPTREKIDPVRFISNYSSGKQGYEIAKAFSENGYETTLITGPTSLKVPENVKCVKVISAEQMLAETIKKLPVDVAVFTAAVSDFKIKNFSNNKIKKTDSLELSLEKNIDILNYVSKHNSLRPKIVIGFSAETKDVEINSLKKLNTKNCDWIVANDVSKKDIGFNSDINEVSIFYKNRSSEKIAKMSKSLIANELVRRVNQEFN